MSLLHEKNSSTDDLQDRRADIKITTDRAITTATLTRLAGLSALLAGDMLRARWHIPSTKRAFVSHHHPLGNRSYYCLRYVLLRTARHGRALRQASEKSGWLGLAGYVMFSLWLVLIMGFSFVEAFILPRLATAEPRFVQSWMGMFTGPAGTFNLGALPTLWTLTAPVYMVGGLLFGIATFRAGILPRWAGVLLAIGTVLAPVAGLLPNASQPKVAVPVGASFSLAGVCALV